MSGCLINFARRAAVWDAIASGGAQGMSSTDLHALLDASWTYAGVHATLQHLRRYGYIVVGGPSPRRAVWTATTLGRPPMDRPGGVQAPLPTPKLVQTLAPQPLSPSEAFDRRTAHAPALDVAAEPPAHDSVARARFVNLAEPEFVLTDARQLAINTDGRAVLQLSAHVTRQLFRWLDGLQGVNQAATPAPTHQGATP